LNEGRSFVTTGPMLLVTFNGKDPGHRFETAKDRPQSVDVQGIILSERPVTSAEVIVDGEIAAVVPLQPDRAPMGSYMAPFRQQLTLQHIVGRGTLLGRT